MQAHEQRVRMLEVRMHPTLPYSSSLSFASDHGCETSGLCCNSAVKGKA